MLTERLSSLAVFHCYKHWEIDIEKVIHSFVVKKKRRFGFLFAIDDDIDDQIDFAELRNFECIP
jgi:hypothetical protein